ncbi:hypothetical protein GNX18_16770 [Microbulbifer sp. SH-1]|uniref:glycoside hydrolase family 3 C-terminal domain-containing protein n=1 Tax=Microbulbifer sp. SH-1 TaxID=2681547 RepID=UPI00140C6F0C|nr:glycoside hydrolase family 3 C-terminal domain-containing protein [Microbulbifer sp. SH-1]QIL91251.1 hypothetical protein GNX18_16770 [Microbulbifer sp. SH-1]
MNSALQLVQDLTLEEKISMLSGDMEFYRGMHALIKEDCYHNKPFLAAANKRLGIPGLAFVDGPRGVVLKGGATCFPVTMARGATWNPQLEERVGEVIGKELRALGGNLFGGVCINLLRHPSWGRAQETYGEDPMHVGILGAALTRGVERHALACVKHFAANSIENARFQVNVNISKRALHEMYLPHFKRCIDAGASAVMTAYNSVNDAWCGENRELLVDILKDRWKFTGFVLSDFVFGVRDPKKSKENGLDLEMPFSMVWGSNLLDLVKCGEISESQLDSSLVRLITPQLGLSNGDNYKKNLLENFDHRAIAKEAACQGMVLLKNSNQVLPLSKSDEIVVLGKLADTPNLGDRGSSDCRPDYVITPLEGLRNLARSNIQHFENIDNAEICHSVSKADSVIVVVGYTYLDEGEHIEPPQLSDFARQIPPPPAISWIFTNSFTKNLWPKINKKILRYKDKKNKKNNPSGKSRLGKGGDRISLGLSEKDVHLIEQACLLNDRVVVAVMSGSAVTMEEWRDFPQGILMMWYPGMEGGNAFAELVFGDRTPSGKLPFVIPKYSKQLPSFDKDAKEITYDLWHGYRKLDADNNIPAFPFGFGLSYNEYTYTDIKVSSESVYADEVIQITLSIFNNGQFKGEEVVQIYVNVPCSSVDRPSSELKAFKRVAVEAMSSTTTSIDIYVHDLAYFDEESDNFVVEPTDYILTAARFAGDPDGISVSVSVLERSGKPLVSSTQKPVAIKSS